MTFRFQQIDLQFKTPFVLASGTRSKTEALILELNQAGVSGYGEACFPPYVQENREETLNRLNELLLKLHFPDFKTSKEIVEFVDAFNLPPYSRSILVNALFDFSSQQNQLALSDFLGVENSTNRYRTTLTVTRSDLDSITEKKLLAVGFSHLKLKLNGDDDIKFVADVKQLLNKSFCVDVNQGWENKTDDEVIYLTNLLKQHDCELIEQPFHKGNHERHRWLSSQKLMPVIADEGLQNLNEYKNYKSCYDGVNVKLLKCGGIDRAADWAKQIKTENKIVIIGCMSESSCGCATAIHLGGLADYLDTDGPFLITNDPFEGLKLKNGTFEFASPFGTGIKLKQHE